MNAFFWFGVLFTLLLIALLAWLLLPAVLSIASDLKRIRQNVERIAEALPAPKAASVARDEFFRPRRSRHVTLVTNVVNRSGIPPDDDAG